MKKLNTISILYSISLTIILTFGAIQAADAQDQTVSGTVFSTGSGEALPGVTILVKGTATGTSTSFEGEFSLTVPSLNDTLVLSYIGYETLEEPINGRTELQLFLTPRAIEGDELVVIGYGAVERRDITGAVASVSAQDIQEVPITDPGQALQGRAAGVVALSAGNRPGQGVTMYVRGRRSLTASNEPLFVIDGIPLEGGLNDINPRDIESMEVLKDASATAIYGSRGANGVILVTTNRGGNRATQVSYSGHTGIRTAYGAPEMMNGEQFATMKEFAGFSFTSAEIEARQRGVSTNWVDYVLEDGIQHDHQLTVSGGDENTQFSVSGNFHFDRGVISSQDFTRNTLRVNLDHSISDRFSIGTSTQLSRQVQNWGSNPYGGALATNPLAEPYDEQGNLILRPGADPLIFNPLADLVDDAFIDERERVRIFSNVFANLRIHENLNYRMNFGPDVKDYRRGLFQGSLTGARQEGSPFAEKQHRREVTYTFENILTYDQNFENHAVNITGLFSIQEKRNEWSSFGASELPYEHQRFHNIGSGATIEGLSSSLEEWGMMSYMARVNYRFMDRYLLTVTGRYDGSSRLSEEQRWGFFPSVAVGWRISDEEFMRDSDLFSDLRVRVSYGKTGNTAIDPYQTRGGLSRTNYSFGGSAGFGYRPTAIANPDLRWETSATFNIGLDFGFWGDRLAGSFEFYQTNTSDLLLSRAIPITSGFNSVLENIGDTRNQGFEFSLTSNNIHTSNFSWTTNVNIWGNKEQIVELYGSGEDDIGNRWFIGQPVSVWFDYDMLGIWQLNEAAEAASYGRSPGEIKLRDVTGSGSITEDDRVVIGSDMPIWNLGVGNRFRYKDFDLSVFLFGSFGHTIYNEFLVNASTLQGRYNNLNVDYWTPDNPSNTTPKPDGTREFPLNSSARGYQPGDFLKVRNIQFGYNMPTSVMESIGIRTARIYVNAETPFIFTRLDSGLDPEGFDTTEEDGRMRGGRISAGVGPTTRLFTVGVNINF